MSEKRKKEIFIDGEISPQRIADSIAKHSDRKNIGAHSIFLGQVREDDINGKKVIAIEYSSYEEMAEIVFNQLREEAFSKFELTCMHIYHSLGKVEAGKISLFVFTSSMHRKAAMEACNFVVEEIKAKAPVWGKELLEDETYRWKQNTIHSKTIKTI